MGEFDLERLAELQRRLAARVVERVLPFEPCLVGGVDVHISGDRAVAAVVTVEVATSSIRETRELWRRVEFPYVPGFLSFREAPAAIDAVRSLTEQPDLLFVDGQGRAHPRRFGLACHIGVELDVPTIGVAKSKLVGRHPELPQERGAAVPLVHRGEVVGMVVRTKPGARPVYVSVGHRITLSEAVAWTLRCTRDRIPEPTRQAHLLAQRALRAYTVRGEPRDD